MLLKSTKSLRTSFDSIRYYAFKSAAQELMARGVTIDTNCPQKFFISPTASILDGFRQEIIDVDSYFVVLSTLSRFETMVNEISKADRSKIEPCSRLIQNLIDEFQREQRDETCDIFVKREKNFIKRFIESANFDVAETITPSLLNRLSEYVRQHERSRKKGKVACFTLEQYFDERRLYDEALPIIHAMAINRVLKACATSSSILSLPQGIFLQLSPENDYSSPCDKPSQSVINSDKRNCDSHQSNQYSHSSFPLSNSSSWLFQSTPRSTAVATLTGQWIGQLPDGRLCTVVVNYDSNSGKLEARECQPNIKSSSLSPATFLQAEVPYQPLGWLDQVVEKMRGSSASKISAEPLVWSLSIGKAADDIDLDCEYEAHITSRVLGHFSSSMNITAMEAARENLGDQQHRQQHAHKIDSAHDVNKSVDASIGGSRQSDMDCTALIRCYPQARAVFALLDNNTKKSDRCQHQDSCNTSASSRDARAHSNSLPVYCEIVLDMSHILDSHDDSLMLLAGGGSSSEGVEYGGGSSSRSIGIDESSGLHAHRKVHFVRSEDFHHCLFSATAAGVGLCSPGTYIETLEM